MNSLRNYTQSLLLAFLFIITFSCKEDVKPTEQFAPIKTDENGFITYYDSTLIVNGVVNIPDSIKGIGEKTFINNKKITTIIGKNVITIKSLAFAECSNLKKINIPNIETIGENAFYNCSSIEMVSIGNILPQIKQNSFANTPGSKELNAVITKENKLLFSGWAYENKFKKLNSEEISMIKTDKNGFITFYHPIQIKNGIVNLPDSIKGIAEKVFMNNKKLKQIIGKNVMTIKYLAFSECSNLENCTFNNLKTIEGQAFEQCNKLKEINFENLSNIGNRSFVLCSMLKKVNIPNIRKIGKNAFSGCSSLELMKIGKILPYTYENSFTDTPYTKELNADISEKKILSFSEWAYNYKFKKLNSKIINTETFTPEGMFAEGRKIIRVNKEIVFNNEDGVIIPDFFTEIGDDVFAETGRYPFFEIYANGITKIGNKTFSNACNLYTVELPNVKEIGNNSFEVCYKFRELTLPSVEKIGDFAFRRCSFIYDIYLPKAKEIGKNAFSGCKRLEKLRLGVNPPAGENIFGGISKIYTLEVPKGSKEKYEKWKYRNKFKYIVEY